MRAIKACSVADNVRNESDEMRGFLVAAVLIFSTLTVQAQDTSWYQKGNFGDGKKKCSEWSKDKSNSAARKEDVSWILGYLSADAARPPTAGRDLHPEEFPAEIDSICATNPESDLRMAASLLAIQHGLEPMPN